MFPFKGHVKIINIHRVKFNIIISDELKKNGLSVTKAKYV